MKTFPGIQQSILDPFLLLLPTRHVSIIICTDGKLVAITESQLHLEETTVLRFE